MNQFFNGQDWRITAGSNATMQFTGDTVVVGAICPDLLEYKHIGAADNWRGRVVRAFFWLMRVWKT